MTDSPGSTATPLAGAEPDALIDLDTARAYGCVSRSTWRRLVSKGVAPAPVDLPIASHRWRRSEVMSFWGLLPEQGS